jgi:23S rRNA pseudouridine1911/1915/1917 synthase
VSGDRIGLTVSAPGGRLDRLLAQRIPELSRTRIQHLIRSGMVIVNGDPVSRPGHRLAGGEQVVIAIPEARPPTLKPEAIPLDILYEDDDLIVVNKPSGMVVHPAAGHSQGTLVHAILAHAPDIRGVGGEARPGVVHRLDKETSGLILFAKHDLAHRYLQRLFKEREIQKTYLAIVDGRPATATGRVEAAIGRDPKERKRMSVVRSARGREAVTLFKIVEAFADHSLLEAKPETGRTHQIRVHLAFLGCPVVGDRVYGQRKPTLPVARQMLHAWKARLVLPGEKEPREFEAPVPLDFQTTLRDLRTRG